MYGSWFTNAGLGLRWAVGLGGLGLCIALGASAFVGRGKAEPAAAAEEPAPPADSSETARLELLDSPEHRFGEMRQEQTGVRTFRAANRGGKPLYFDLAEVSCGCTTVRFNGRPMREPFTPPAGPAEGIAPVPLPAGEPLAPLPMPEAGPLSPVAIAEVPEDAPLAEPTAYMLLPGQTAELEVRWETRFMAGPFEQTARVRTSDPAHPVVVYKIQGEVAAPVEVSPPLVEIRDVAAGKGGTGSLLLSSRKLGDLQALEIVSDNPWVKARAQPVGSQQLQGSPWRSAVSVSIDVLPGAPVGPFEAHLKIRTTAKDRPEVRAGVIGEVRGGVTLLPAHALDFGLVLPGPRARCGLYARFDGQAPSQAKIVRVEPDFIRCRVDSAKTRNRGEEVLLVEAEIGPEAPSGDFFGRVELETAHPTAKRIAIPVRGRISR